MNKAKNFLEKWGFHALLLPVFFVLHSYQQYFGLVSGAVAAKWLFILVAVFALSCLLFWLLTRHLNRSLQLVTLFGFVVLFYGVIKDFLEFTAGLATLSRYSVLLPLTLVVTGLLAWVVLRKKDFRTSNLFQNLLLLIFVFIDAGRSVAIDHFTLTRKNLLTTGEEIRLEKAVTPTAKPDIFYLVFDSYPGTAFLEKFMHFDNSSFVTHLEHEGFRVLKSPRSNYNRTAFSIASTLNCEYLKNITSHTVISPKQYAEANLTTKFSVVPAFLEQQGYRFHNLSVFDFENAPSIHKETFLTMPEADILLFNTLPERFKTDVLWNLLVGKYAVPILQRIFTKTQNEFREEQEGKRDFNRRVLDSLVRMTTEHARASKFVYAHFYLPHPPFFFDENGKENDFNYVITEASLTDKNLFLSYLRYTNKIITDLVTKIKSVSTNPVIIIQSDHGFRDFKGGPDHPEAFFTNFSAFYFPDRDYSRLYDRMTNVNTFPVILDKYFGTTIPLRQDSCVFLPY